MKLPREEKERYQQAFREMNLLQKLDYIVTYFKLPITLVTIVLVFLGAALNIRLHKKNVVLYTGLINVEAGYNLQNALTVDFLEQNDLSVKKDEVRLYQGLYLTSDPASEVFQYVYASRLKVLAAIESKELDVVLMNREAYDTFSQSGYLLNLAETELAETCADALETNLVIYEDNAEEHSFDESIPYKAVTGEEKNALSSDGLALLQEAGFGKELYVGIIANSERVETAENYLLYLKNAK